MVNPHSTSPKSAGSLRDRLKEATSQAILEAAELMLAEQGMAVSLGAIASRAGVAVGTIYNYFADRDELLAELFRTRRAEMLTAVDTVLKARADAPFREQLSAFLVALLSHFDAHRAFLRIALDHDAKRSQTPAERHSAFRTLQKRCLKLMETGVREKVLRADDAELYAGMLLGMVRALLLMRLDDAQPFTESAEQLERFFLHGAEGRR